MIVVASILEKGDVIIMDGTRYRVLYCDENEVDIRRVSNDNHSEGSRKITIGRKSKKKMIFLEDCDWGELKNFPNIFIKSSQ